MSSLLKLCCLHIAFCLVVAYSQGTPICDKPNQVHATCGCPLTCEDDTEITHLMGYRMHIYRYYRIRNCTGVCETGCQCDWRHYDDGNGNCVLAKDCPMPPCPGPNEMYVLGKRPNCPYPSCRHMLKPSEKPGPLCHNMGHGSYREPGCICKANHVRSDNGTCIPVEECPEYPPQCGDERKEFKECISPCQQPTCNYTGMLSANQTDQCVDKCISACVCKSGFFMNFNGVCILPEECPKEIFDTICEKPNQIHLFCGPYCTKSCEYLDQPPICRLGCDRGCYCKAGYVRSQRGCVPEDQCDSVMRSFLDRMKPS